MKPTQNALTERMQKLVNAWQTTADRRVIFLNCYLLMTQNMLTAVQAGEFHETQWVARLVPHFASYYFRALVAYEQQQAIPVVWQLAYEATRREETMTMQHLLLGINAHINYDLVFALEDLLADSWPSLTTGQRQRYYEDYCHVNAIIGRTIDAVQDEVIEQFTPRLDWVDRLMGPLDEWLMSHLITGWRDRVWADAVQLVKTAVPAQRAQVCQNVEDASVKIAQIILLPGLAVDLKQLLHS